MFVTSSNSVGEFISPFGSRVKIPAGMVSTLPVTEFYWLLGQPEVSIDYESDDEQKLAQQLFSYAGSNPMRGIPKPQFDTPNATLHLDGGSTKYPVIVINPVALFAENQGYKFAPPRPTLHIDREMLVGVVRQVLDELSNPSLPQYEVDNAGSASPAETIEGATVDSAPVTEATETTIPVVKGSGRTKSGVINDSEF